MKKTDLNQFVQDAIRTESKIEKIKTNRIVLRDAINMAISTGNLLDMLKKNIFYGKEIDVNEFHIYAEDIKTLACKLSIKATKSELERKETINMNPRLFHSAIGIFTEATEMLEAIDIYGAPIDDVNFCEELGDVSWYQAIAIDELIHADMDEVLTKVIDKLKSRYPEKFTSDKAINRDLKTERKILEFSKNKK